MAKDSPGGNPQEQVWLTADDQTRLILLWYGGWLAPYRGTGNPWGHSHKPSPSPQSTCGLVSKLPNPFRTLTRVKRWSTFAQSGRKTHCSSSVGLLTIYPSSAVRWGRPGLWSLLTDGNHHHPQFTTPQVCQSGQAYNFQSFGKTSSSSGARLLQSCFTASTTSPPKMWRPNPEGPNLHGMCVGGIEELLQVSLPPPNNIPVVVSSSPSTPLL